MAFNYGTELYVPQLSTMTRYPSEGKLTYLCDSDFIPYNVGFCSDMQEYCKFLNAEAPYSTDIWESKQVHALQLLNKAVHMAKCDSVLVYLTNSKDNFRNDVAFTQPYKGSRDEDKPPFFQEIKDWMHKEFKANMSDGNEADDEVCIEAQRRIELLEADDVPCEEHAYDIFADFVIGSQDKDLDIIRGKHSHPTTGVKFFVTRLGALTPKMAVKEVNDYEQWPTVNGKPQDPLTARDDIKYDLKDIKRIFEMLPSGELYKRGAKKGQPKLVKTCVKVTGTRKTKRVTVGKKEAPYIKKLSGTGLHFFFAQVLMGDTVDCYAGLDGVGGTKAYEVLNGSTSEQELFNRTIAMYKEVHGAGWYPLFLEQAQLAWMQEYRGQLWTPEERGLIYEQGV